MGRPRRRRSSSSRRRRQSARPSRPASRPVSLDARSSPPPTTAPEQRMTPLRRAPIAPPPRRHRDRRPPATLPRHRLPRRRERGDRAGNGSTSAVSRYHRLYPVPTSPDPAPQRRSIPPCRTVTPTIAGRAARHRRHPIPVAPPAVTTPAGPSTPPRPRSRRRRLRPPPGSRPTGTTVPQTAAASTPRDSAQSPATRIDGGNGQYNSINTSSTPSATSVATS